MSVHFIHNHTIYPHARTHTHRPLGAWRAENLHTLAVRIQISGFCGIWKMCGSCMHVYFSIWNEIPWHPKMGKRTEMKSVYTWIVCLVKFVVSTIVTIGRHGGRGVVSVSSKFPSKHFRKYERIGIFQCENLKKLTVSSIVRQPVLQAAYTRNTPQPTTVLIYVFITHSNFFSVCWMNISNSAPKTKWINSDKCMCLVSNFLLFVPHTDKLITGFRFTPFFLLCTDCFYSLHRAKKKIAPDASKRPEKKRQTRAKCNVLKPKIELHNWGEEFNPVFF